MLGQIIAACMVLLQGIPCTRTFPLVFHKSETGPGAGDLLHNLLEVLVIQIDKCLPALEKELLFIEKILCKICMLIRSDVIRRNVGEYCAVKHNPRHPVHFHRLGGNLHNTALTASLCHLGKIPVKIIGLRRCIHRRIMIRSNHDAVGSNHSRFLSGCLQNGFHHMGGCSLSLGSRHSDHQKLPGGISKPGCRKSRQSLSSVFHYNHRHLGRHLYRVLCHKHPDSGLCHLGNKVMGISSGSLHADKHCSRSGLS